MPDVKFLGTFGERRSSDISGLSSALATGIQTGVKQRNAATAERVAQNTADTDRQELDIKRSELIYKKLKLEEETKSIAEKATMERVERMSAHFGDDVGGYKNQLTSEGGKVFAQQVKKYLPEMIGPDGNPMLVNSSVVSKARVDKQIADLVEMERLGTLDENGRIVLNRLEAVPEPEWIKLFKMLNESFEFKNLPNEEKQQVIADYIAQFSPTGPNPPVNGIGEFDPEAYIDSIQ